MHEIISTHVAAMCRQGRRLRVATATSAAGLLAAAVLVVPQFPVTWLTVALGAGFAGLLYRKVRRFRSARVMMRQLRLEEQFACHGPAPERVVTCLRRRQHLWASSLVLRGLKRVFAQPPAQPLFFQEKQAQFRQAFTTALAPLRPRRLPADLLAFAVLLVAGLYGAPEALLTLGLLPLVGAFALVVVLAAEVTAAVLEADLDARLDGFVGLLCDWALGQRLEETLRRRSRKTYRHRPVYNAAAALGLRPLREVA